MSSHLPPESTDESNGFYAKVKLKNVKLWQPCAPDQAMDWVGGISEDGQGIEPYPVERIPYQKATINTLYVILHPDGSIWRDGSLYLYYLSAERGRSAETIENIAGDLCHFMNEIMKGWRDYLNFEGEEFSRPTYYYQSVMKRAILRRTRSSTTESGPKGEPGKLRRRTANRKTTSMIGFYRWLVSTGRFRPQQDMWQSSTKYIRYTDRHGFTQTKEVISTDLTFRVTREISAEGYIEDGGKLYPISRDNQRALIDSLVRL